MTIVDTHCHAGLNWFEPVEVLLARMNANGVGKAALIQHRGTFDNGYLFERAQRCPGKFAAVAIVDAASATALDDLERWAEMGACGIRMAPLERSPGAEPLAIRRKAAELGLVASSLEAGVLSAHMDAAPRAHARQRSAKAQKRRILVERTSRFSFS